MLLLLTPVAALAWEVCEVKSPTATFSIPHLAKAPDLNTDPHSATWSQRGIYVDRERLYATDRPSQTQTEVRAFWTDSDLISPVSSPRMTSSILAACG